MIQLDDKVSDMLTSADSVKKGTAAQRILIVEDDASVADILNYNFRQAGYDTQVANDGEEALEIAGRKPPELVILDLMLPRVDGIEVCRRLRGDIVTRDVLIVMLTAKAEETDQLIGFAIGADDYVTKPFSIKVLMERVKALLRRRQTKSNAQDVVVSQGIMIDRRRHIVSVGDEQLDLTPSEFGLLDALIRQPGRAFSRSDLIDHALGEDTIVLERTIDVHIRSLRRKLGDYASLVETVRGIGYRFRDISIPQI